MHPSTLNTSTLAIGWDWGNVRVYMCLSTAQQNVGIESALEAIRITFQSVTI